MEKTLFTALLLITLKTTVKSFSHSSTFNHTSTLNSVGISQDGRTLMVKDNNYLLMYMTMMQNGLRYIPQTQVGISEFHTNRDLFFPRYGNEFFIARNSSFVKLYIDNFTIKTKWQISTGTVWNFIVIGENQGVLYTKNRTYGMWLYENQQGKPTIKQLQNFPWQIKRRYGSPDGTILGISCENCNFIHLYKIQKQPSFTMTYNQQIVTPSSIDHLRHFSFERFNRFLVYSYQERIYIYKRNIIDGKYQFHQQVVLQGSIEKVQFVGSDICLCYTSVNSLIWTKLQIVNKTSEMFEIIIQKEIFIAWSQIHIRQNYTLILNNNQLTVLYDCRKNCVSCNALRKCLTCQEGYLLQKGKCRIYDQCLAYEDDKFQVCQQYCSKKCIYCKESMDNCIKCKQSFYSKEECTLKEKTLIIGIILLALTTVRLPRHRIFCMVIGNFQFYAYHKFSYDGIFKELLDSINTVNAVSQNLMQIDVLKQLFQSIKVFTNFNAFANQKYLQTEGMNGIFVTNFIILSLPTVILKTIIFFLLNRIFYRLFHKRISKLLRIYSFKLYLIEILLISQLPNMVFLFLYNSKMLFQISQFKEWLFQSISVLIFGVLMFTILILFFFYRRNYGKLEYYFYTNCSPKRGALQYLWIKYILKAVFYGAIHALLFENPSSQLLCLTFLQVFSLILTLITATRQKIFISKIRLCIDFLTEFILSILNIFLCWKLSYSIGNQDLENLMEKGIKMCIWSLLILVILFFAIDIIQLIVECKKLNKPNEKQKNDQNIGEEDQKIYKSQKQQKQQNIPMNQLA